MAQCLEYFLGMYEAWGSITSSPYILGVMVVAHTCNPSIKVILGYTAILKPTWAA